MQDYNVAPSAVTFGTVVKAYGRARDTEAVIKVWNQMRSRSLDYDTVLCSVMFYYMMLCYVILCNVMQRCII